MPFGWLKALQIASALYSHRDKVRPLLDRVQRRGPATIEQPDAVAELSNAIKALAIEAGEQRRLLRTLRVIGIAALVVSLTTLGIVIAHVV